jgi:hypothetical protein
MAVFLGIASLGIVMPNATAAAMACFDEHAGCASAVLGVLQSTSDVIASTAVSALADGTAWPMKAVMLTCAIAALAMLGPSPSVMGSRRFQSSSSASRARDPGTPSPSAARASPKA